MYASLRLGVEYIHKVMPEKITVGADFAVPASWDEMYVLVEVVECPRLITVPFPNLSAGRNGSQCRPIPGVGSDPGENQGPPRGERVDNSNGGSRLHRPMHRAPLIGCSFGVAVHWRQRLLPPIPQRCFCSGSGVRAASTVATDGAPG